MPVPAIKLAIPEQSNEFVANIAGATYVQLAGTTLDTVGAMDTYAINATGGEDGRTFVLKGETSYFEQGLQAGKDGLDANDTTVTIGKSGYLHGEEYAVRVYGDDARLTNRGMIASDTAYGMQVKGDHAVIENDGVITSKFGMGFIGDDGLLVNNGSIVGNYGIWAATGGTQTVKIVNTGIITGSSAAIFGDDGREHVINRGTLNGDLQTSGGNDIIDLRGGTVNGTVRGGDGNDLYIINDADINIMELGGQGVDTVRVSVDLAFNDSFEKVVLTGGKDLYLTGWTDGETLIGNRGNNHIDGGNGNDTIRGGRGNDTLTGGLNADTFVFVAKGGKDVVTDFTVPSDTIDLSRLNDIVDFADLVDNHAIVKNGHMIITANDSVIVLKNTTFADVDAVDFIF